MHATLVSRPLDPGPAYRGCGESAIERHADDLALLDRGDRRLAKLVKTLADLRRLGDFKILGEIDEAQRLAEFLADELGTARKKLEEA